MNNPDTDEIVNYLSTKFNKIFCERDFVCCVAEDFQAILNNQNKCCVLVFPVLGPIYQKAVRYQAKIFDLAVFGINCGRYRSIAVCHKQYLVKKSVEVKEETMAESVNASRRKRPERQLYVPPAQRNSRLSPPKTKSHRKIKTDDQPVEKLEQHIIPLTDILDLQYEFYYLVKAGHNNCIFNRYIYSGVKDDSWIIPIYSLEQTSILRILNPNYFLLWQPKLHNFYSDNHKCANFTTLTQTIQLEEHQERITRPSVLLIQSTENLSFNVEMCNVFTVLCLDNNVDSDDVIDLTVFHLPHFFIFNNYFGQDYCVVCEEGHDVEECYLNKKSMLLETIESERSEIERRSKPEPKVLEISKVKTTDMIKNNINTSKEKKIHDKKLSKKHEHDQEKEIMRKTKENINRKTKPIMKYVEDNNDTLKIDKMDNVNNWEDLFDDEGQLQDELFTEIKQKVGNNVTIMKATEDYSAYTTKPIEEFEHVVELYNFPPTLETHDIIQVFSGINTDAMYIKWVDDTHALLVLGSLSQAQKAIELDNPLIKARPMSAASGVSLAVAYKSDLKPAMKRPQTNLQTARRLITTHLGAKTRISKEQSAKEREDLKAAREMKRLAKQNEKDAWEGFCRSSN